MPRPLTPRPEEAFYDQPQSYSNGCHTTVDSAVIRPCIYGKQDIVVGALAVKAETVESEQADGPGK